MPPAPVPAPHVAALWIYPVKSLGGVAVSAAQVGPLGLAGDRRWMLVDADGWAVTQRQRPAMARLRVALDDTGDDTGDDTRPPVAARAGAVAVTAPDGGRIRLTPPGAGAARRRVRLFDDVVEAAACDPAADAWFSARLGDAVRLVYLPDDVVRPVDPAYAAPGDRAPFSDGYPVLVASQASLDDLNARLAARGATPVAIERFRPNVLVAGAPAWAEDGWRTLAAGGAELALVKPCARCTVTTVDPARGAADGPEPLRTLAEYRRVGSKVLFAQNAVVRADGMLAVGDAVRAAPAYLDPAPAGPARARAAH